MINLNSSPAEAGMRAGSALLGMISKSNERIAGETRQSASERASPTVTAQGQSLVDAYHAAKVRYDEAETDQERFEAADVLDVMAEEIIVRTDIPLAVQTVIAGDYMGSGRIDPEVQASAFLCVYDTAKRETGS